MAGQAIVLAATPIITRLYLPADFGALAIFSSLVAVLGVVAALRYEVAIPIPEDDRAAANLLALSAIIIGVIVVISASIIWLGGPAITRGLGVPQLQSLLWLVPVGLIGTGLYQTLTYWAVRRKTYKRISHTKISQSLCQVLVQLGLARVTGGASGLIAGDVAGRAGATFTLGLGALRDDLPILRLISRQGIKEAAIRFKRFPYLSSGSVLLNSLALYLPPIVLSVFYGPAVAGWFALSQRVIAAPLALISRSVTTVYTSQAAEYVRHSKHLLGPFVRRVYGGLLVVGVIPVAIVILAAPNLFSFAFGNEWVVAGQYTQVLGVAYFVHFVAVPVSQTLNLIERQDIQLWWDGSRLCLVSLALIGPPLFNAGPMLTITTYAVAMIVSYSALVVIVLGVTKGSEWGH